MIVFIDVIIDVVLAVVFFITVVVVTMFVNNNLINIITQEEQIVNMLYSALDGIKLIDVYCILCEANICLSIIYLLLMLILL